MISYDYTFRVRYKDIDRMGIMYYSRYFEYFEAARTDLMRALGMTYHELEEAGVFMPVVHTESDYSNGAEFDDHLRVVTQIREIHRSRMEIHYQVQDIDGDKGEINRGISIHAFVSPTGRAIRMPQRLKELLELKWGTELIDE